MADVSLVSSPSLGSVAFNAADLTFTYTPSGATAVGVDSFIYTATDELGNTSPPETVTLVISTGQTFMQDTSTDRFLAFAQGFPPLTGTGRSQSLSTFSLVNNPDFTLSLAAGDGDLCADSSTNPPVVGVAGCADTAGQTLVAANDGGSLVLVDNFSQLPYVFGAATPPTQPPLTIGATSNPALWKLYTAPTFTAASPPAGTASLGYTPYQFLAPSSTASTFAVTAGSLPPGLTLNSDGDLSGTPTTSGSYPFVVTATNAVASTSTPSLASGQPVSITIASGPSLGDANPGSGAPPGGATPTSINPLPAADSVPSSPPAYLAATGTETEQATAAGILLLAAGFLLLFAATRYNRRRSP
jgi:hypothetical protein